MKTFKSLTTGLLLVIAGALFQNYKPARADQPRHHRREVVIVSYQGIYGPIVIEPNGGYRPQIGLATDWTSASAGAPVIQQGTNLAEALAALLEDGFQLQPPNVYGEFLLIK